MMIKDRQYSHSYTQTMPDGQEIDVTLNFYGYYDPGCTYGPIDRCYPPEGEVHIWTAETQKDGEIDFDDWVKKWSLTDEDVLAIENRLMEQIQVSE